MFWKKKLKLPVTEEDKTWVEDYMLFVRDNFGDEHFRHIVTILPNAEFYNKTFTGTEEDAHFIFNQTKIYMGLDDVDAKLKFFSDQPVLMADGTVLSTPADIHGKWNSAAGYYEETEGSTTIYIENSELKNPLSLVATIAHELSHYILLGEERIEENDEYLTDLVAIIYGFGIFLGNSRFQHSSYSDSKGSGWQMSSTGYLPEQVIAYAMAWLSVYRDEEPIWKNMLNASMLKYFDLSMEYIKAYPEKVRFT